MKKFKWICLATILVFLLVGIFSYILNDSNKVHTLMSREFGPDYEDILYQLPIYDFMDKVNTDLLNIRENIEEYMDYWGLL